MLRDACIPFGPGLAARGTGLATPGVTVRAIDGRLCTSPDCISVADTLPLWKPSTANVFLTGAHTSLSVNRGVLRESLAIRTY